MATIGDDVLNGTNKADTIYGLEGSDTIHGLQGNDKIVGEIEELLYSNIAGALTLNGDSITLPITPPAFSGDNLFGDQGNDLIIGDLVTLSFVVQAGTDASQTFGGASATTPITITFGDDTLDGGVGQDLLVGDVDTILLSAKAGSTVFAAPVSSANATLQFITLNMGIDTLYGGEGIDTLYGDVRLMTLESIGGTANDSTAGNQSASSNIQGITFVGGVDHLYGGNGDDTLVGDIGELNLLAKAGTASGLDDVADGSLTGTTGITNVYTMGGDFLYGENGDDKMFGDVKTLNISAYGGATSGGASSSAVGEIRGNTFHLGWDELHGGNGNDDISGDIGTLTIFAQAGDATDGGNSRAFIQGLAANVPSDIFNAGHDILYGGDGDDRLVGDIITLTIDGKSGDATSTTSSGNFSLARYSVAFNMGDDTLDGGSGNDHLYGDYVDVNILGHGGTSSGTLLNAVTFSNVINGSIFNMGADHLYGRSGDDHLYGDVGVFNYDVTAGTITALNTQNATSPAGAASNALRVTMGNDYLDGGDGQDELYGDADNIMISLHGGINTGSPLGPTAAAGIIVNSFLTMGNDELHGGSGNDILYGDIGALAVTLFPGTDTGTGCYISNTLFKFGADILEGGSGNDELVGDIADPVQLSGFLNAPLAPTFPVLNQLIFGNDTFQFSLGGANGNDVVKDMNGGATTLNPTDFTVTSTATCTVTNVMDSLVFSDAVSVAAVDAASTFSNSGGHLLLSFNAGGSVLFENIDYVGQDSVLDITPNVTVI